MEEVERGEKREKKIYYKKKMESAVLFRHGEGTRERKSNLDDQVYVGAFVRGQEPATQKSSGDTDNCLEAKRRTYGGVANKLLPEGRPSIKSSD